MAETGTMEQETVEKSVGGIVVARDTTGSKEREMGRNTRFSLLLPLSKLPLLLPFELNQPGIQRARESGKCSPR